MRKTMDQKRREQYLALRKQAIELSKELEQMQCQDDAVAFLTRVYPTPESWEVTQLRNTIWELDAQMFELLEKLAKIPPYREPKPKKKTTSTRKKAR